MSFLRAEWRRLVLFNYEIEPSLLKTYLPYKTELDLWNGKCYVSLVGFMFMNTRVFGLKFPFHTNFEEINLRFYVKYNDNSVWKRGVVFIKEIVPKSMITFIANTMYNEHYITRRMHHHWIDNPDSMTTEYGFQQQGEAYSFSVQSLKNSSEFEADSETEFITEHFWGYSRSTKNKTTEYEVTHPSWEVYEVIDHKIDFNFGSVYGNEFSVLNHIKPTSVMLAEGSEITVESKRIIR